MTKPASAWRRPLADRETIRHLEAQVAVPLDQVIAAAEQRAVADHHPPPLAPADTQWLPPAVPAASITMLSASQLAALTAALPDVTPLAPPPAPACPAARPHTRILTYLAMNITGGLALLTLMATCLLACLAPNSPAGTAGRHILTWPGHLLATDGTHWYLTLTMIIVVTTSILATTIPAAARTIIRIVGPD